jgi:hypothetical protein
MTDETARQHPGDVNDEPHGQDNRGEAHGHDDDGDGPEPLGPIDVQAWGALILGIGMGLAVAVCVAFSTSSL